jgi:hypothetical protein
MQAFAQATGGGTANAAATASGSTDIGFSLRPSFPKFLTTRLGHSRAHASSSFLLCFAQAIANANAGSSGK